MIQKSMVAQERQLIRNMKKKRSELEALLQQCLTEWNIEDAVYRFYHQSFKVYGIQVKTRSIIKLLRAIAPKGRTFCKYFQEIIDAGAASKQFEREHNRTWTKHTRPMLEAFFHARYFLEMAVKYARELLDEPPKLMPSGWAALRELFMVGYAELPTTDQEEGNA